jgi:cytochrome P450
MPVSVSSLLPLPVLLSPHVLLLLALGLVLLLKLSGWLPALGLQFARLRELSSRLWRLLLALLVELVWVNPALRRARHARRRPARLSDQPLPIRRSDLLFDLIFLPADWLSSLGLHRLARPDPTCEEKVQRRLREAPGLAVRLRWVLARHLNLYFVLSVLRLLAPRLWLPAFLWKRSLVYPDSYPGFPIAGVLMLSRCADVQEVLARPDSFHVVYGPRMQAVTQAVGESPYPDGEADPSERGNFLLGMQDTPRYYRDVSNMRLAFRREDANHCGRLAQRAATAALARILQHQSSLAPAPCDLSVDLPVDLVIPVAEALVRDYFGIPVPLRCETLGNFSEIVWDGVAAEEIDHQHYWLESLFHYIFYDLKGDLSEPSALDAAPRVRRALLQAIQQRRQTIAQAPPGEDFDDVLSRCLRLQASGTPGMDDDTLCINLTGFLVGAMTPLINASCQVIDVLLERPQALSMAQAAARADDHARLQQCVMEALRFLPGDPLIYRWTNHDSWLGEGLRRSFVPKGTFVMAWNSSAMFDPVLLPAPWEFRVDRLSGSYMHWGLGQHRCAGDYINMAVIPAMLAPLLRLHRLQRAPGASGQPQKVGITIRHFDLLVKPGHDGECAQHEAPGR